MPPIAARMLNGCLDLLLCTQGCSIDCCAQKGTVLAPGCSGYHSEASLVSLQLPMQLSNESLYRINTSIDWSVVVHAYGDPTKTNWGLRCDHFTQSIWQTAHCQHVCRKFTEGATAPPIAILSSLLAYTLQSGQHLYHLMSMCSHASSKTARMMFRGRVAIVNARELQLKPQSKYANC